MAQLALTVAMIGSMAGAAIDHDLRLLGAEAGRAAGQRPAGAARPTASRSPAPGQAATAGRQRPLKEVRTDRRGDGLEHRATRPLDAADQGHHAPPVRRAIADTIKAEGFEMSHVGVKEVIEAPPAHWPPG